MNRRDGSNRFELEVRRSLSLALIDQADVIERILRHLRLWEASVRVDAARDPPEPDEPVIEPWLDDPFPDYDHEPVFAQN
ncbi:MAG: hypothetical protein K9N62_01350 [Verrucomicrobia bacterium]|nr:hypothetical protein [Verrucomicrobiota bacterium]